MGVEITKKEAKVSYYVFGIAGIAKLIDSSVFDPRPPVN